MSNSVVQFGYGMPLRTAPEQGSLRIEFVFRSDDNRFLTFHGDVDRWATSAVLSGRPDAAEQLLDQMGPIFRSFCKEVHKHFGLGALEQDG
jgi:hypothetical protein